MFIDSLPCCIPVEYLSSVGCISEVFPNPIVYMSLVNPPGGCISVVYLFPGGCISVV